MTKGIKQLATITEADKQAAHKLQAYWNRFQRHVVSTGQKKMTQEEAGEILGMTQGAVSQYLSGRTPLGTDATIRFAKLLGIRPQDIRYDFLYMVDESHPAGSTDTVLPETDQMIGFTGTPIMAWENPDELDKDETVMVKQLDAQASAGNGHVIYTAPEKATPLPFSLNWINKLGLKEENLFCMGVKGDSMQPVIMDGAEILVDKAGNEVIDGKIYLVRLGNKISVKRLYNRIDGGITVKSDNPAYDPVEVTPEQMQFISVIGRVRWYASEI